MRLFQILSTIWFIPFGFLVAPLRATGKIPHPLCPRNFRDLTLNKMMFPDNITRAIVSDKIAARGWASERIDARHFIELYDICDSVEELRNKNYPYPYVVKTNHASGQYAFVQNNIERAKMLETAAQWNGGEHNPQKEWGYRGIQRKFIVEKMLVDANQPETMDVKVFCFFGKPVFVYSVTDRKNQPVKTILSLDWKPLNVKFSNEKSSLRTPDRPVHLSKLLHLASVLSEEFDMIRVDFMILNEQIYFGELTSFNQAGQHLLEPHTFDEQLLAQYQQIRQERISQSRSKYHKNLVAVAEFEQAEISENRAVS